MSSRIFARRVRGIAGWYWPALQLATVSCRFTGHTVIARDCRVTTLQHVFRCESFSARVSLVLSSWVTPLILSAVLSASHTKLAARPVVIARRVIGSRET